MPNRRSFLLRAAMAAVAGKVSWAQAGVPAPRVRTGAGELEGALEGGVRVFRGVPFAQPPTGALRFRPPQPPLPWSGVRRATQFAAEAPQPGGAGVPQSEDCLYLNVWAPQAEGPHPVFVWVHGGGFTGGRSFDPLSDGTGFARSGVVCVTVAYRLGVFGFLDLGEALGPGYAGTADNGLRDLIAALTWVQGNIAAFGGDPCRVTVGGESAGAKLIDLLLGVPSAAGLFQQAISESGGAERIWPLPRAQAVGAGFCSHWATVSGQGAASLRTANGAQIIAAQQSFEAGFPVHFPLRPEMDSTLIPQTPLTAIRSGLSRGKRLLIGTNRDESALFLGPHPAPATGKDLGNVSLAQYEAVMARYAAIYPEMTVEQLRIRSVTAEEYWIPSLRVAEAHTRAGGQSYVYQLDYPAPSGRYQGFAYHSFDLRFVWDYFGEGTPPAAERSFAKSVHGAWIAFIQGEGEGKGEPLKAPGLPAWPRYAVPSRPTMILDAVSRVAEAPQAQEFALWDGLMES